MPFILLNEVKASPVCLACSQIDEGRQTAHLTACHTVAPVVMTKRSSSCCFLFLSVNNLNSPVVKAHLLEVSHL